MEISCFAWPWWSANRLGDGCRLSLAGELGVRGFSPAVTVTGLRSRLISSPSVLVSTKGVPRDFAETGVLRHQVSASRAGSRRVAPGCCERVRSCAGMPPSPEGLDDDHAPAAAGTGWQPIAWFRLLPPAARSSTICCLKSAATTRLSSVCLSWPAVAAHHACRVPAGQQPVNKFRAGGHNARSRPPHGASLWPRTQDPGYAHEQQLFRSAALQSRVTILSRPPRQRPDGSRSP